MNKLFVPYLHYYKRGPKFYGTKPTNPASDSKHILEFYTLIEFGHMKDSELNFSSFITIWGKVLISMQFFKNFKKNTENYD